MSIISIRSLVGLVIFFLLVYVLVRQLYISESSLNEDIIQDVQPIMEHLSRNKYDDGGGKSGKSEKKVPNLGDDDNHVVYQHPLCDFLESSGVVNQMATNENKYRGWRCDNGMPVEDVCTQWTGVQCDEDGIITSIDLSDLHLKGDISNLVKSISTLRHLDLSGNAFYGHVKQNDVKKVIPSANVNTKWVRYNIFFDCIYLKTI